MRTTLSSLLIFLSIGISGCGSEPAAPPSPDLSTAADVDLREPTTSDLSATTSPDLATGATTDLAVAAGDDGGSIIGPAPDGGFCHGYGWGAPAVSFSRWPRCRR